MRARVVITDARGNTFEGEVHLSPVAHPPHKGKQNRKLASTKPQAPKAPAQVDFGLPVRAFVRTYGAKSMGGPQKFVLLLAWMSKGQAGRAVSLQDLENAWNKMTEPMGSKFNPAYTTRAKDNGWVDTPKKGSYGLRSNWKDILAR